MGIYKDITSEELTKKLSSENPPVLIDVRTPGEYSGGHIPKSINIPVQVFETEIKKKNIKNDNPIVVYCQSGMRASKACSILHDLGYTDVYNLYAIGNYKGTLE